MIKVLPFILLAGVGVCFWQALKLADTEIMEMSCFDVWLGGGYRVHQKHNGFNVLTSNYDCPPLIDITVISEGKEENLTILPKARGTTKVKYSKYLFRNKNKNFTLKKDVYERIRATISLSKEVDEFLASHVEENRHGK